MQEQAPSTHDVQPGDRKRLTARNSDTNGRDCADSVCECRSKRLAPTVPSVNKQIRNEWDICNSWLFCSLMKRMCRSVPSLAPLLSISPRFCLSFYFYVDKSPQRGSSALAPPPPPCYRFYDVRGANYIYIYLVTTYHV